MYSELNSPIEARLGFELANLVQEGEDIRGFGAKVFADGIWFPIDLAKEKFYIPQQINSQQSPVVLFAPNGNRYSQR